MQKNFNTRYGYRLLNMKKVKKTKTLSFRLLQEISDKIEGKIDRGKGIKDRTDFGNQAVKAYLQYLEFIEFSRDAIIQLIFNMSENSNISETPEFMKFEEYSKLVKKKIYRA